MMCEPAENRVLEWRATAAVCQNRAQLAERAFVKSYKYKT